MSTDLRTVLAERIDALPAAPGHLDAVRANGRRIRRTRRALAGGAVAVIVLAVGTVAVLAGQGTEDGRGRTAPDRTEYASLGALDFSEGVRAYGDAEFVSLGGREFPAGELEWLDTDAVATSDGIVFYDAGRPVLLTPGGEFTPLVSGALDGAPGFEPTAKADVKAPLVVWATLADGRATITVHDLRKDADVASTEVGCGRCSDLVIDGIDGGVVFVRDGDGTRTWDSGSDTWQDFAGPQTRVADVRNGVVLYDGPAPSAPGDWRLVPGAIDAQLTFDGKHVLYWSSTLQPTEPGGEPVVLEQGPADGLGDGQWTFDTDGSVLVITRTGGQQVDVYDCAVPSGTCEKIGSFAPQGGDPVFMGNDM